MLHFRRFSNRERPAPVVDGGFQKVQHITADDADKVRHPGHAVEVSDIGKVNGNGLKSGQDGIANGEAVNDNRLLAAPCTINPNDMTLAFLKLGRFNEVGQHNGVEDGAAGTGVHDHAGRLAVQLDIYHDLAAYGETNELQWYNHSRKNHHTRRHGGKK